MHRRRAALVASLVAAAAAAAVGGCGGHSADPARAGTPWTLPNVDAANTRHVRGPIDAVSVARLRPAWTLPLSVSYTAEPAIADGVAYTQDTLSDVYAIDLDSGRLRWKARFEAPDQGPNGVAVVGGRVYGATNASAFALDRATGRALWSTRLIRHPPTEGIDMAPGYHDGTVYISTVPAAGGDVGTLWALDAATGRPRWRWEQVPRSLWGNPKLNGGGGMWHPPAFDERGALYVSVANPDPWPGTRRFPWGSSRPGPNRWNNSLVKLDARTGRVLWGRQVLPHDVYDWDLECPPILARAGGRRLVLTAGKMGFVFAFDADSGQLVWKVPVGRHNGHDDDSRRAMRGDYAGFRYEVPIYPGDWGGVQTQMASDGRTLYVPVNDLYAVYHEQNVPEQQDPMQGTGELVALDVATGHVRWIRRLAHLIFGGATISNDLVFTNTYEGTLWALDAATGAVAFHAPLPAGTDAPVAIAGDVLLTGSGIQLTPDQQRKIVAFRLGGG
jgi:outer membrane protein assembly factor BamB